MLTERGVLHWALGKEKGGKRQVLTLRKLIQLNVVSSYI